jgi:hypothetical protein
VAGLHRHIVAPNPRASLSPEVFELPARDKSLQVIE